MGQSASLNALWMVDAVLGQPEDLPHLKDVERVHPKVIRILGQNPGQLMLQGTNTYLVGDGPQRILIDTSDGNLHWWPLLQQVLRDEQATITQVLLTHGHQDHVGDLHLLRTAYPEVVVRKRRVECDELQPLSLTRAFSGRKRCACDSEAKDYSDYSPVSEGESFRVGDCFLRVLLTPGHSSDSISLVLEQAGQVEAIFTGDCVLGGRTARFSELMEYNQSLSRLLRVAMDAGQVSLLPGHGDVISTDSAEYLQSILRMQTKREKAILRTLQASPGTAGDLCNLIYGSTTAALMAQELVEQHLEDLQERGRVTGSADFFGRTWWEAKLVPAM